MVLGRNEFPMVKWRDTGFSSILCLFGGCEREVFKRAVSTLYCDERCLTTIYKTVFPFYQCSLTEASSEGPHGPCSYCLNASPFVFFAFFLFCEIVDNCGH